MADEALVWAPAAELTEARESFQDDAPHRVYRAVRTALDPVLALPMLMVCLPVFIAIAVGIRLDSAGPTFFRQQRVGRSGKPFTIWKFRTLTMNAPTYSLKVAEHHPVVTRFGRFLRRTGLDELPQLLNVVRGDMALIGPRPEQIGLIHLYEPWQLRRLLLKPGITGWWQIHHRDGVPLHLNVDKDLFYINNQGVWIDLLIVLGTFKVVLGSIAAAF